LSGKSLDIAFYCADNTPSHHFCPDDLWGRGLGGAEQYLVSLAEALAAQGHRVTVFNQPPQEGMYGKVLYSHTDGFDCQKEYDAFILYRNPDPATTIAATARAKIFLSCDQQTCGHYGRDVFPYVDYTVCISPYHVNYHIARYGVRPEKIGYIDIGVRLEDYRPKLPKNPGQCIYCSIPDRGLEHLAVMWPRIRAAVPEATLFITSDYRLWGVPYAGNEQWVALFKGMDGVSFVGKVPRKTLVRLQLTSDLMLYPSHYEELFCVSAAECMAAGAYPITSTCGALPTTVGAGTLIPGAPASALYRDLFVQEAVALLKNRELLTAYQDQARRYAKERFDYKDIAKEWVNLIRRLAANKPTSQATKGKHTGGR